GGKGGTGKPSEMGEKVTYASLTKEIKDSVPADPKGGNNQKALQAEFDKRVKAGEPAPWQELFIAQNRNGKTPARQKGSSDYSGRVLTPKILGGEEVLLNEYPDPRGPLMDWLRHKDNPYFARAFVNRVWATYFGRGIVEPADDMNLANPPVNKELMDYLTEGFVAHGYDMKWLHREIVTSDAYQRSWKPTPTNKLDEKNFSRFVVRRLPAEIVVDALAMATAGSEQIAKFASDVESRAIGPNVDGYTRGGKGANNTTLVMFGKPARESNCDCERTTDPTLLQTLYTRNDPEMLARLEAARKDQPAWITELRQQYRPQRRNGNPKDNGDLAAFERKIEALREQAEKDPSLKPKLEGALARLDEMKKASPAQTKGATTESVSAVDTSKLIVEAFLRTVSRPPTERELKQAKDDIAAARDPIDGVRDLLWAMLNTREFMVNH
ncbi:MAG: DUF1553 domain-containing protein, partial [Verrucomicrobia bacterium]|nr:DUF1553 domain-containing protein [Verrucomicrobiota bacterium]